MGSHGRDQGDLVAGGVNVKRPGHASALTDEPGGAPPCSQVTSTY